MGDRLTDNPLQSADRDQKRNACCGRETARCRIEMYSGIAQSSLRLRGILLPNESLRPITSYLEYLQAWNLWNFSKSWSARRQSLTEKTNRKSIRSRTNHFRITSESRTESESDGLLSPSGFDRPKPSINTYPRFRFATRSNIHPSIVQEI